MDRLQTILLLGATLLAAPLQAQELKSGDVKKLAKPIGKWIEAKVEGDYAGQSEAKDDLFSALEKVQKKLKKRDVLSLVRDWEILLDSGRTYPTSGEFVKKGKWTAHEFIGSEYLAWLPSKYNPKKSNYPLLLVLTDGDREALANMGPEILDNCIVLAPSLEGLESIEPEELRQTQIRMLGTAVQGAAHFRVDRNRLFLVGQGEVGGELASDIAALFPYFFAGLAVVGGPAETATGAANLELLPSTGDLADFASAADWCMTAEPRASYPDSFHFELVREWAGRAYWVLARNFDVAAAGEPASSMEVSVDRSTNTITINTIGVYSLQIFLNDLIVDLDQEVTVVRNGVSYKVTLSRSLGTVIECFEQAYDAGAVYTAKLTKLDVPIEEESGDEGN